MEKDSVKQVTFKCRFKRFSTYLKSGKRVRFSDGIYRTTDPDAIEFLRKNYRPPMMAEVVESEKVHSDHAVKGVVSQAEKPAIPPFFPGQSEVMANFAAPPAEAPEVKKSSKK